MRQLIAFIALASAVVLGGCVSDDQRGPDRFCGIHAVRLSEDTVLNPSPVRGSIYPWYAFERAKPAEFPEAWTWGIERSALPTWTRVRYCEACREAEARWMNEHSTPRPAVTKALARARQGAWDFLAGAPSTCRVHNLPLKEDAVPIAYGLVGMGEDGYADAMPTQFPYAATHVLGGCVSGPASPTRALVMYCPECRVAQAEWLRAVGSTKGRARPAYVGMLPLRVDR
jgi:hypothetical protein